MNVKDLRARALDLVAAIARLTPTPTLRPWGVANGESGDHGDRGDDCPLVGGAFVQFGAADHVVAVTIDAGDADRANAEAIAFVCNHVVGVVTDLLAAVAAGPTTELQRTLARIVLDHEAWGGSSGMLSSTERAEARAWARRVLA